MNARYARFRFGTNTSAFHLAFYRLTFTKKPPGLFLSATALGCLLMLSGCSYFNFPREDTCIQVKTINGQLQEYAVALDNRSETDIGIRLTDRHAIHLDFQWLWDQQTDSTTQGGAYLFNDDALPPPRPWFRCTYRF